MAKPVAPADVVWTYSGVRPLFDDGDDNPSAVTRDYHLEVDAPHGVAPLLSVFGGKITTYRRLAEHCTQGSRAVLSTDGRRLDSREAGGRRRDGRCPDFREAFDRFVAGAAAAKPGLPKDLVRVLARRHGSGLDDLLENVNTLAELGHAFVGIFTRPKCAT